MPRGQSPHGLLTSKESHFFTLSCVGCVCNTCTYVTKATVVLYMSFKHDTIYRGKNQVPVEEPALVD